MIIVKIQGGLGNQMFEYAFARKLSHIYKVPLKLDATNYDYARMDDEHPDKKFKRGYGIGRFNTIEVFATDAEINKFKRHVPRQGRLGRLYNRIFSNKSIYLKENHFHFVPEYLKPRGLEEGKDIFVDGYFQTEKYFKDIEDIIRKEFTFKDMPDSKNAEMIKKIESVEAVCVHIRRGNFVLTKYNHIHGVCPISYYEQALAEIRKRVKNPHFFVFSDDHAWVKENLDLGGPTTYVDHNGPEKDYEDIRLMSTCRHHIIANSSFSWWGAWLSKNPNKIVIWPSHIFKKKSVDAKDFGLPNWIKIETELV